MIKISNITFSYPGAKTQVFEDFSLCLQENRIYGLLGENGTGKSTLLYLISGLLSARTGSITVDEFDTRKRHPDMLKEIFLVPEEFDLPNVSLETYIRINTPFYPRFDRKVLDDCLDEFGLPKKLRLNELSMGQKKKVFMSFALAAGTRFLLMDEPTNGLDIPSKSLFRKVVAKNMTDERTLIISTHQVRDVEALLDHILILNRSRMLLDASVADICERYTFGLRNPADMDETVLYAEPSLQGNSVMALRKEGDSETSINLELLFNAVASGKLNLKNE